MIESILEFWLGDQGAADYPSPARVDLWFRASPEHDWQVYRRFHRVAEQALQGSWDDWGDTPRGRLALILLLDQFPRHLFRHTAWAYQGDAAALRHCRAALELCQDRELTAWERLFLYAPLEHCEDGAVQQEAVTQIEAMMAEVEVPVAGRLEYFAHWIRVHRDVIEQFGRFPWRNRALGRVNTPQETDYLANHPPYLGQW